MKTSTRFVVWLVIWAAAGNAAVATLQQTRQQQAPDYAPILNYINQAWGTLTRSATECKSVADTRTNAEVTLYFPAGAAIPAAAQAMEQNCKVEADHLPEPIDRPNSLDTTELPPGLLYLPNPYVVPGGMFNEMYGWDSYFIIRGLIQAGKIDLARGMVENFFYEIQNYAMVLNASRTYFLSRSQPPFLTSMIFAVYDAESQAGHADPQWLATAYNYAVKDHDLWTRKPHLAGNTGLARYYDFGEGPAPELAKDGYTYYRHSIAYFLLHPALKDVFLVSREQAAAPQASTSPYFSLRLCSEGANLTVAAACEQIRDYALTESYYKGDRSMRESGFDVSSRFGPLGAQTQDYAPVCLNSLLYKTELDLARMAEMLHKSAEAGQWKAQAEKRARLMRQYFWNASSGLYFDYDWRTRKQSTYVYATTFYPLWVGMATPAEAHRVMLNLKLLEHAGGLAMSTQETLGQWDYPYGWAPIQLTTDEGLRRYGFNDAADRLSREFLSTVNDNFKRDGTIREKYNVVTRSSETHVEAGYSENMVGFGWTNGAFLVLLEEMRKPQANAPAHAASAPRGR
jgi:alpha,alpha-trehalase